MTNDSEQNPPYGTVNREYGMKLAMTADLRSVMQFAAQTAA